MIGKVSVTGQETTLVSCPNSICTKREGNSSVHKTTLLVGSTVGSKTTVWSIKEIGL